MCVYIHIYTNIRILIINYNVNNKLHDLYHGSLPGPSRSTSCRHPRGRRCSTSCRGSPREVSLCVLCYAIVMLLKLLYMFDMFFMFLFGSR